jgi:hypothetical protein
MESKMVARSKSVGKSIAANSGAAVAPQASPDAGGLASPGAVASARVIRLQASVPSSAPSAITLTAIPPDPSHLDEALPGFDAGDRLSDLHALVQASYCYLDSLSEGASDPHGAAYAVSCCVRTVVKQLAVAATDLAGGSPDLNAAASACFDASAVLQAAHALSDRWVEDGLLDREPAELGARMLRGCWRVAYQLGMACSEAASDPVDNEAAEAAHG